MLNWIITFWVLGMIAALLGFGGFAGKFTEISKIMAMIFWILFALTVLKTVMTREK